MDLEHSKLIIYGIATITGVIGCWIAWKRLNAGRDHFIAEEDYALANRLMTLSHKLEGVIRQIRNPMAHPNHGWDELDSVGKEIDEAYHEAWTHWGDNIFEHKQSILDCVNELRLARRKEERSQESGIGDERRGRLYEEYNPILNDYSNDGDDEFSSKVKKAVEDLAVDLRPYLEK